MSATKHFDSPFMLIQFEKKADGLVFWLVDVGGEFDINLIDFVDIENFVDDTFSSECLLRGLIKVLNKMGHEVLSVGKSHDLKTPKPYLSLK